MRGRVVTAGMLLLLLSSTVAAAQEPAQPPSEAVESFARAREHYRNGRYREAIAEIEHARTFDAESPTLIYNLARLHELVGDLDPAIAYYEQYVTTLGTAQNDERGRVEETLQRLRGARAERDRRAEAATSEAQTVQSMPPASPRYEERQGVADLPFWITLGAGAALVGAGSVLGAIAMNDHSDADDFVLGRDGGPDERAALQSNAEDKALVADILLVGGASTMIAAGILYVTRTERTEVRAPAMTAFVGADGRSMLLTVRGEL